MQDEEKFINDQLLKEDFHDVAQDVHFNLSIIPSDPTLELLMMKLESKELIVPSYQRKFVWSIEQASSLVESFLIGLPIPQVFFYINKDGILEIIDGQQRIMSIKYFFDGYFNKSGIDGKEEKFALTGLSNTYGYNGKTFAELSQKDQRRLKNSTLRTINIRTLDSSDDLESIFHIFKRLNTGGTSLTAQEIRNAVYSGEIVTELKKLNKNKHWIKILGSKLPYKNQRDIELILRIFSLYRDWSNYEKPMAGFLNKTMNKNKDFNSEKALSFKEKFPKICEVISNIQKPFRPKGVINTAILDAVFVALLEYEYSELTTLDSEELNKNYNKLLKNENFLSNIDGSTADNSVLKKRIKLAISYLK